MICGQWAIAHHLMHAEPSAMSSKSGDDWAAPLCGTHHDELHAFGHEADWWLDKGIDIINWCKETYQQWLNSRPTRTIPPTTS